VEHKLYHQETTRPSETALAAKRYPGNQRRKETRICYKCGKPGHIAKNCRSSNGVYNAIAL